MLDNRVGICARTAGGAKEECPGLGAFGSISLTVQGKSLRVEALEP